MNVTAARAACGKVKHPALVSNAPEAELSNSSLQVSLQLKRIIKRNREQKIKTIDSVGGVCLLP